MQRTYVRRRRTAAAGVLLVIALLVGSPVASAFGGSEANAPGQATHVVRAGETLWSIAQAQAPDRDPREVTYEIATTNDLGDRPLVPGETLIVPASG